MHIYIYSHKEEACHINSSLLLFFVLLLAGDGTQLIDDVIAGPEEILQVIFVQALIVGVRHWLGLAS